MNLFERVNCLYVLKIGIMSTKKLNNKNRGVCVKNFIMFLLYYLLVIVISYSLMILLFHFVDICIGDVLPDDINILMAFIFFAICFIIILAVSRYILNIFEKKYVLDIFEKIGLAYSTVKFTSYCDILLQFASFLGVGLLFGKITNSFPDDIYEPKNFLVAVLFVFPMSLTFSLKKNPS